MLETNIGWEDALNPTKIQWLDEFVTGKLILDLGAGKGWYSTHLAKQGYSVTALDQNPLFENKGVKVNEKSPS